MPDARSLGTGTQWTVCSQRPVVGHCEMVEMGLCLLQGSPPLSSILQRPQHPSHSLGSQVQPRPL